MARWHRVIPLFACLVILSHLYLVMGQAAGLDRYGGYRGLRGTATGFFHTEKLGNQWWLITPEGRAVFLLSVSAESMISDFEETGNACETKAEITHVSPALRAVAFGTDWQSRSVYDAREQLKSWGFHSVDAFFHTPVTAHLETTAVTHPPMMGACSPTRWHQSSSPVLIL